MTLPDAVGNCVLQKRLAKEAKEMERLEKQAAKVGCKVLLLWQVSTCCSKAANAACLLAAWGHCCSSGWEKKGAGGEAGASQPCG